MTTRGLKNGVNARTEKLGSTKGLTAMSFRTMPKPPIPDFSYLERHISRYRQLVCQGEDEINLRLRQGGVQRGGFSELVGQYSWIWFDAYGVLNRGTEPIPGAADTLERLRRAGIPFRLVSNNASNSPQELQNNLAKMGIYLHREEIVTSGMVVADFVQENRLGEQPYLWVGDLVSAHNYAPQPHRWMVNHPQSRWEKDAACYALFSGNQEYYGGAQEAILRASGERRGVPLLLVNADLVAPEAQGSLNLVSGFTACEAHGDGRFPLMGIGKPFRPVFETAWRSCGCPSWDRVLMVGDALETDILGGACLGTATCLTLTGLYGPMEAELENIGDRLGIRPDYLVQSIAWDG